MTLTYRVNREAYMGELRDWVKVATLTRTMSALAADMRATALDAEAQEAKARSEEDRSFGSPIASFQELRRYFGLSRRSLIYRMTTEQLATLSDMEVELWADIDCQSDDEAYDAMEKEFGPIRADRLGIKWYASASGLSYTSDRVGARLHQGHVRQEPNGSWLAYIANLEPSVLPDIESSRTFASADDAMAWCSSRI